MRINRVRIRTLARWVVAIAGVLALTAAAPAAAKPKPGGGDGRVPVVVFPAFHFTKLQVAVSDQRTDPACPASGVFEDWFLNDHPSATFSQVCQDELMTLRVAQHGGSLRFSEQPGVSVQLLDYGKTSSAPFYEPMYEALEAAGYTRDRDIRVAGYDSRLTPDLGKFLQRTRKLIEATSRENGGAPVHLVGHSNGPIYAHYLLTHSSRQWKARYIHGFTPIAGNLPGQGSVYGLLFTGLNVTDFTLPTTPENALSSARMYQAAPSTYLSSADPAVHGDQEVVISDQSTGRTYTPLDYRSLLTDAGLDWALPIADRYIGFAHMSDASSFPFVDVYAEKGSGLETLVGFGLHDLSTGQLLDATTEFFTRDGDINQEDLTNDAVSAWAAMPCYRFSLTDNPGVNHFELPGDPGLLARFVAHLAQPASAC
jgi:lecithin-cholesterol acyltransferase